MVENWRSLLKNEDRLECSLLKNEFFRVRRFQKQSSSQKKNSAKGNISTKGIFRQRLKCALKCPKVYTQWGPAPTSSSVRAFSKKRVIPRNSQG